MRHVVRHRLPTCRPTSHAAGHRPGVCRPRRGAGLAIADRDRAKRLFDKNGTSPQNYDHAVFEAQSAAVAFRSAEFAVQIAAFEQEQARAALLLARDEEVDCSSD